jgi:hypothetical protein
MNLRSGVNHHLEKEANRLLRESLKGVTKHSEKSDLLTPWKEADRLRREVYVASGVPDPSTRRGIFHRSRNADRPELNSRDGVARPRRTDSLSAFVSEHGHHDNDNFTE